MFLRITFVSALTVLGHTAFAGEPYHATNDFAASGYDVVAYFQLPRVGPKEAPPPAVPGHEAITAEYEGGIYAFATAENRDAFLSEPTLFA